MEKLIIIANLGRVRPVKFKSAGDDPLDQAHLVEVPGGAIELKIEPISGVVTDQAGRFRKGNWGERSGMSYGEEHEMMAEMERQALERLAATISGIVATEGFPPWRLILPQPVLPALLNMLTPEAHRALSKAEPGDLTKMPIAQLEKRLLSPRKTPT